MLQIFSFLAVCIIGAAVGTATAADRISSRRWDATPEIEKGGFSAENGKWRERQKGNDGTIRAQQTEILLTKTDQWSEGPQGEELQKETRQRQLLNLQQQTQSEPQVHPGQREEPKEYSGHEKRQQLELHKKRWQQRSLKEQHELTLRDKVQDQHIQQPPEIDKQDPLQGSRERRIHEDPLEGQHKKKSEEKQSPQEVRRVQPQQERDTRQQHVKLQKSPQREERLFHTSVTVYGPNEVKDVSGAPRDLQHIVQRQVLDFDAPAEHPVYRGNRHGGTRDPGTQHVEPVTNGPDSAADVRGQEQSVLWGSRKATLQLPQQVNMSQVLIQNSPQLFFNYDQPQQRGSSKSREGGNAGAEEYNWQQHVRGQPGRSDSEEQHQEEEENQQRLQQQQQQLLEELFALGRSVDQGQRQLSVYQKLRQQLQMLQLMQLHLVQQLELLQRQEEEKFLVQQEDQHQQGSTEESGLRGSVSLVPDRTHSHDSCASGNSSLTDSFLRWLRVRKTTAQLLALNADVLRAVRGAGDPHAMSSEPAAAKSLQFIYNGQSPLPGNSEKPDAGTPSFPIGTSNLFQMRQTQLALGDNLPSDRAEDHVQPKELDPQQKQRESQNEEETHQHERVAQTAQRLPHPQQREKQPPQHHIQGQVSGEAGHTRDMSKDKPHKRAERQGQKKRQVHSAVHAITTPHLPADVRGALTPLIVGSARPVATGPFFLPAPADTLTVLEQPSDQQPHVTTTATKDVSSVKQQEEKQRQGAPQGDKKRWPVSRPAAVGHNSQPASQISIINRQEEEGVKATTALVNYKNTAHRGKPYIGSVNEDEKTGNTRQEHKHEDMQGTDTSVQAVSIVSFEERGSHETRRKRTMQKVREGELSTAGGSVTKADALASPDNQQRVQGKSLEGKSRYMVEPSRRKMEEGCNNRAGVNHCGGRTPVSPVLKTNCRTGETEMKAEQQTEVTAYRFEGFNEAYIKRAQRSGGATVAMDVPDKQLDLLPQHKLKGGPAPEAADKQPHDRGSEGLRSKSESAKRAGHSIEARRLLSKESQRRQTPRAEWKPQEYEEELVVLIDRVAQQQEEIEQQKRILEQQRAELTKMRSTFDFSKQQRPQQASGHSHAPLQENENQKRRFRQREKEEEPETLPTSGCLLQLQIRSSADARPVKNKYLRVALQPTTAVEYVSDRGGLRVEDCRRQHGFNFRTLRVCVRDKFAREHGECTESYRGNTDSHPFVTAASVSESGTATATSELKKIAASSSNPSASASSSGPAAQSISAPSPSPTSYMPLLTARRTQLSTSTSAPVLYKPRPLSFSSAKALYRGCSAKSRCTPSFRALQLFSRSAFGAQPDTLNGVFPCRTSGQPCAASNLCCETLQCVTPISNTYAPRIDGRGTCEQGTTAAGLSTSAFRLPIQIDPVFPLTDENDGGTTRPRSFFNGNGGLPAAGEENGPDQSDAAARPLPGGTAANRAESTGTAASAGPGLGAGPMGILLSVQGTNGMRRDNRAGFAGQYRLPNNSRMLRK